MLFSLDIAAYISLLLVLCFLLVQAADLIEDALVVVAEKLGISSFAIGFIVLSIASSLPEASLLVSAAAEQKPSLSVGNLIGASIILLTLVVAINVIKYKEVEFGGQFTIKEVLWALVVLSIQVVMLSDGRLDFVEGLLGLGAYLLFTAYIYYLGNDKHLKLHTKQKMEVSKLGQLSLRAMLGLIGLVVISSLLVDAAIETASLLNVPESTIGLIVLAVGTNIPEIIIAIRSKNANGEQMAVGNFIGSAAINTAILGGLAILSSGQLENFASLVPSLIVLGATIVLFGIVAWSDKKIKRPEALILIGVYVLLLITEGVIYAF